MKTDGALFSIMRYRKDKKGLKGLLQDDLVYQRMDEETAQVIGVLMGVDKFMEKRQKYRKVYIKNAYFFELY